MLIDNICLYCFSYVDVTRRNGKNISWEHLRDIYSKTRTESGLALVPRLKYEHVNLTNFSKMRVDLAAQVS